MQSTGKDLKTVLDFLREYYPKIFTISEITKGINNAGGKMNGGKALRLLPFAFDEGWVTLTGNGVLDIGPYRLTSAGIRKLNNWTDEDNELSI